MTAEILKGLKSNFERRFNRSLGSLKTVLTVPICFNEDQRNELTFAAALSGLNCLRVLSEPTAAAIAAKYGEQDGEMRVIVIDIGESSHGVSVLDVKDGEYNVEAWRAN